LRVLILTAVKVPPNHQKGGRDDRPLHCSWTNGRPSKALPKHLPIPGRVRSKLICEAPIDIYLRKNPVS